MTSLHPPSFQRNDFSTLIIIRALVDTLCRHGMGQISRDLHTKLDKKS